MDVTLGPWKAAQTENLSLAEAMGDEAWKTVEKSADFTPQKPPKGKAAKGYGVSGKLTSVVKQGRSIQVHSTFTIWVDGTLSNVPPIAGNGSGEGSPAEDVVRTIAEMRIKKILETIKTGRVVKAA